MPAIPVGTSRQDEITVTKELAIDFLGNDQARVLSTPNMVLFFERCCRNTVLPFLDPGHDTVGTHVNVYHLAAAPLGTKVTFHAQVTSLEDRRVNFAMQATAAMPSGEDIKIGEGTHQRAIINVQRFVCRLSKVG